ncbi:MAG: AAA family ATPase [Acidobacteria bacterium]|nr:AAA family ATPase [Acidobacteriota bacterium]
MSQRQRIVLAIGLPGAGKSTWFHKQGITPLSSDHLRFLLADDEDEQGFQAEIFRTLRFLLDMRVKMGRPVSYIDATNLVIEQRQPFLDQARELDVAMEAIFFDVPLDVCLKRNSGRQRRVPQDVMQAMAEALEPPTIEEGFSKITVIGVRGETLSEHEENL